jgi:hypothetical protein
VNTTMNLWVPKKCWEILELVYDWSLLEMGSIPQSQCINRFSFLCRGIEWTNLTMFLSFAYPNVSSAQGQVRNELFLTDTLTGNSLPLRTDKGDEPPVDMVRVSPLK